MSDREGTVAQINVKTMNDTLFLIQTLYLNLNIKEVLTNIFKII